MLLGGSMTNTIVKEYDAKIDEKKRVAIRNSSFSYYHVKEYSNGSITLEPRVLVAPFEISKNTLNMMDESIKNLKKGKVSKKINVKGL